MDRQYAQERLELRQRIASVMGVTANAINNLTNNIKDNLPLALLTSYDGKFLIE